MAQGKQEGLINVPSFEKIYSLIAEKKWAKDIIIKRGGMHQMLGIPPDDRIIDHYKNTPEDAEKLARDLIAASNGDVRQVISMLAIPANLDEDDNVFNKALRVMREKGLKMDDESKKIISTR